MSISTKSSFAQHGRSFDMRVDGYAAYTPTDPLAPFQFERREPRSDDVVMDILYCGVCHTDLHFARNHGGVTTFPVVPGHEIIGRVTSTGEDVARFKVGDIVGVGCMVDSCGQCDACTHSLEQACHEGPTFTYGFVDARDGMRTYGGYSEKIVVSERFVLHVPAGLNPAAAAPLLCAGITTWSPLRQWKVGTGSKVGVIGLGGLGHMAIKLAKGLGADVTLLTRSADKIPDALALGADQVIISNDVDQMQAVSNKFDVIIDTIPYNHDVNPYLQTLGFEGALVMVGYFGQLEPTVTAGPLLRARKVLTGSFIGGVAETQQMLDFCGKHGIVSDIELISIQDINQAFERMLASDVKYRFVIDIASLRANRTEVG
jgi:uncharacterized zinc-type alcohol dehydrogenase-like protein